MDQSSKDYIPLGSPHTQHAILQDTMQHMQPTPLDAQKPDSDTRQQGRMESNGNQEEAPAAQPSRQAADTNGSTARPSADAAEIQEALTVLAKAKKKDRKKREKDKDKHKKGDLHAVLIICSVFLIINRSAAKLCCFALQGTRSQRSQASQRKIELGVSH